MQKRLALVLSFCVLTAVGCSQESTQATTVKEKSINPLCNTEAGMAGGWQDSAVTPEATAAVDSVLAMMNTSAQLSKILDVKTQVVNGINYAIDFELANGEVWNTRVYRSLKGEYAMTQPAVLGSMTQDCQ
ncbi:2-oxoglutarate dehydrogenase [Photobacterium frigidiphilum]|uniref:2-oxoglutarate dehydrogenase n=1 Tax=Photobacterium frigidiphilum TaxID=264736 RepID=A0A2T3JIU5_9GAMM|nr:cystatin domain-containing protein [Photobacterium frigidiphilum]PSU48912.1 2-oxoglutarate dehydrogenase [Photobacterium frigidiphilum]